ncbi:hypothetical protein QVD17_38326 [Tagetes erecta]|uniref:CCHC-type domain-containing protein n=1 Tax=Tagetes erecta TaxID=13708 RepID=A0AAD8JMY9_TARER|nr:hypothetical protein QVD17_38326 [Tagetes erecta]
MGSLSTGSSSKSEVEALFVGKGKGRFRAGQSQGSSRLREKNKSHEQHERNNKETEKKDTGNGRPSRPFGRRFPHNCYNCGRRGHMAKNCRSPPMEESNVATTQNEEGWDAEAFVAQTEEVYAFTATTERKGNRLDEWIVDSGCSNHMTGDKGKLSNLLKYGGSRVVVLADNSKYPIDHIGDVVFPSGDRTNGLTLNDVYHVGGMKKNLLSVPQITEADHYNETVYVLNAESAFVERTKGNHGADLWHQRLGHVGYDKLGLMADKALVNGLPKVHINKEIVCSGCQFGKASQLPYSKSDFKAKEALELVHSDVFGPVKQPSIQGYDAERKGWRCCEPDTGKVYVSRNVIFDENTSWWSMDSQVLPDSQKLLEDLEVAKVQLKFDDTVDADEIHNEESSQQSSATNVEEVSEQASGPRKSHRVRKPNPRYVNANIAVVEDRFIEPESFEEAFDKKEWQNAMKEEMSALLSNQTWDLVPKPKDVMPVSCK